VQSVPVCAAGLQLELLISIRSVKPGNVATRGLWFEACQQRSVAWLVRRIPAPVKSICLLSILWGCFVWVLGFFLIILII